MKHCLVLLSIVVLTLAVVYYENPLVKDNTPDPGAIYVDGVYYVATTTTGAGGKFPIRASHDLVNWKVVSYIFARDHAPSWSENSYWAPEIHYVENRFVAYFVARDKQGVLCVGAAVADKVTGPYKDLGHPLVQEKAMGNIDPTFFKDPATNKSYLIWKEDANGAVPPLKYTPIWAVEVSSNGLSIISGKTELLQNDPDTWEGILVEGPWMIYQYGYYFLFYSANLYGTKNYAIGVARASHPLGPFEKYSKNPILHSNTAFSGPGHCSVISLQNDDKPTNLVMIYHSWVGNDIGPSYNRELMMDAIVWDYSDGYWPYIATYSPSHGRTPVPQV